MADIDDHAQLVHALDGLDPELRQAGTRAPFAQPVCERRAPRPGARAWRRHLSENAHKAGADLSVVQHAASLVTTEK